MDNRIGPTQPDVVTVSSEPSPTPPSSKFSEVMASSAAPMVTSAESAMTVLPGAPLTALAVRGGPVPPGLPSLPVPPALPSIAMAPPLTFPMAPPALGVAPGIGGPMPGTMSAEGPGAATGPSPAATVGSALVAGLPGMLMGDGGMQASLMQSQQMNLYYLQLQQEVDAQNRSFSTLSNVLKSQNDSEKNAIGNMH
jgi:hypothetical protein